MRSSNRMMIYTEALHGGSFKIHMTHLLTVDGCRLILVDVLSFICAEARTG